MLTYCVKCRKDTKNIDPNMQSKCPVCGIKKSRFVKEQEAKGLFSNFKIKTPLSKTSLVNVFFKCKNERNCEQIFTGEI